MNGTSQSPPNYSTNHMKEKTPSGYRKYNVQNFTPAQMELLNQSFEHVNPNSYTAKLARGDQNAFNEMEAPALRQYNEMQGNLASRFSGMGMGARNSSGFQNASNAAAQDFAGQLQAQRQGLQRQAIQDLMGMSNDLMGQRPYDTGLVEKRQKEPGFWHQAGVGFISGVGKGIGQAAGQWVGG